MGPLLWGAFIYQVSMGQWVNGGYGNHMDSWDLIWLVVSHINFIFPFHIWDVILPIDVHIFQDGYCTTNQ